MGGAITPPQEPSSADGDVQLLLQMVWNQLEETANWPTFAAIERALWREHRIDAAKLIARTPEAFLSGGRPQGGADPAPDGKLTLTVAGAADCAGAESVLRVVVAAARLAADSYLSDDPSDPRVTYADVAGELPHDLQSNNNLAPLSGMLLVQEPWRTNTTLSQDDWAIHVDGRIRYYAGVQTLAEYMLARHEQLAAGSNSPSGTEHEPETPAASAPSQTPERSPHPITPILTTGVGLFVLFPSVIQATEAIWAQVVASILLALGLLSLFLAWRYWYRLPSLRNANLGIAALLAASIGTVLIIGNKADNPQAGPGPATPTVSTPSPSTTPVHGTASLTVEPNTGHAGATVFVSARGFAANEVVRVEIFDGALIKNFQGPYQLADTQANPVGEISIQATIPPELCCPKAFVYVRATGRSSKTSGQTQFTLT